MKLQSVEFGEFGWRNRVDVTRESQGVTMTQTTSAYAAAMPRVLVILPAWNEQDSVGATITEVRGTNPGVDLLVVDDGSRDDTFFHMQYIRREFADIVKLVRWW